MLITLGNPPSDAEIDAWHAVVSAAHVRDFPAAVPEPSRAETAGRLRVQPWNGREVHLASVSDDGPYEGVASLLLWSEPPHLHAAYLQGLVVDPGARRRGVGAGLWAAVRERLLAEGRTSVSTRLELGGAGEAFVDSLGFVKMLPLARYVQRVGRVPAGAPAPELPDGLRFAHWTGAAPDGLAEGMAGAHNALADAPTGDLAARSGLWDARQFQAAARLVGDRGGVLVTVAALDPDDAVVGYTQAVLHTPGDTRAVQGDTSVLPAHRGRRIGHAVKQRLLDVLREEYPGVREISTSVADDNGAMLAVNESLGYRRERPAGLFEMKL